MTRQPTTSRTRTPSDPIEVEFHGPESVNAAAHYTITTGSTVVSEGDVQVPAGDVTSVESQITEQGEYELVVSVTEGPEASVDFSVGEYDIRMGSNILVRLHSDEIQFLIEE